MKRKENANKMKEKEDYERNPVHFLLIFSIIYKWLIEKIYKEKMNRS